MLCGGNIELDKWNQRIINHALRQCEEAEVFSYRRIEQELVSNNSKDKKYCIKESSQLSLRILKDGHIGYSTHSGKIDSCSDLVENALFTSKWGGAERISLSFGTLPLTDVRIYDKSMPTMESFPQFVGELESKLKEKISTRYAYRVTTIQDSIEVTDTTVRSMCYDKTILNFLLITPEERFAWASCRNGLIEYIEKKCEINTNLFPIVSLSKTPEYVAVSPSAFRSIIYKIIALQFNGKRISTEGCNNVSFNRDLSIIDDGIQDWMTGSQPFDDEGTTCKSYYLIENGEFISGYFDKKTAFAMNFPSTGNARRSWGTPPNPSINNLLVEIKKGVPLQTLIGAINYGLYITDLLDLEGDAINWKYQGLIKRAELIVNGHPQGIVRNVPIKIDVYKLLNDIELSATDYTNVGGNMRCCSILCSNKIIID